MAPLVCDHMQWFVATYVISGSSSIFSASWVCETSDGVSSGSMNSAFSRLAFFCWPPFTFRSHATSCPVPDALCSLIRVAFLILGNWFRTPRCTPFLQQLRVDYSGRTGGGAGAERAIPHPFAQLMLWARPSRYASQPSAHPSHQEGYRGPASFRIRRRDRICCLRTVGYFRR